MKKDMFVEYLKSKQFMKNDNIEIIPAIMPESHEDLILHLNQIQGLVNLVQVDVMDGVFVPGITWPYKNQSAEFDRVIHEEEGLPNWQDFDFEIDLMVTHPETEWQKWVSAGARRIIIHQESAKDLDLLLADIRSEFPKQDSDSAFTIEIGLAQNIDTPIESIFPYLDRIDFVQCMGIVEIGKQGNPLSPKVLQKIETLKAHAPETVISVDGGVSFETIKSVVISGVDRLVIGSAIFNNQEMEVAESLEFFKQVVNE